MARLDREMISRLAFLLDSSHELSLLLTMAFASSPPGELSPDQTDALTDLCFKLLLNHDEMKQILATQNGQTTGDEI